MAAKRKLTDKISITYIAVVLANFVAMSFFSTTSAISRTFMVWANVALISLTLIFTIALLFIAGGILNKYNSKQKIEVSTEASIATTVWGAALGFEFAVFLSSFFTTSSKLIETLTKFTTLSTFELSSAYNIQMALSASLALAGLIAVIMFFVLINTRKFVIESNTAPINLLQEVASAFTEFESEIEKHSSTELTVEEFYVANLNGFSPIIETQLNVAADKTAQLKQAKKGMTPPLNLFS